MRMSKNFLVTAAIVIFMTALGWRYGYSAASHGERADVIGATFVVLGFVVVVCAMKWLATAWRMATASGPGVSPLRYVMFAIVILAVSFVLIAVLSPLALAGDSFSLGIVMSLAVIALLYIAKREGMVLARRAARGHAVQEESHSH